MVSRSTTKRQPKAMMTSTAATLREVLSKHRLPKLFLHFSCVSRAAVGSTEVRLCRVTPQADSPYACMADCKTNPFRPMLLAHCCHAHCTSVSRPLHTRYIQIVVPPQSPLSACMSTSMQCFHVLHSYSEICGAFGAAQNCVMLLGPASESLDKGS